LAPLFVSKHSLTFHTLIIMDPDTVTLEIEEGMQKALDHMAQEFAAVRTGKASPALVDNLDVHVAAYGTKMRLKELAVVATPEPRLISIQPFDPSSSPDIEKAIRESNLGLNPQNEGRRILLPIPELSEERRKDMVKLVKSLAEEARVRVRAMRKDGMDNGKKMKGDNILTEDSLHDFEASIQDLTDTYGKKIDEATKSKEDEVMTV